ncbi:hypothetical protein GGR57DRAFT_471115 [Xylariaceae sp. FL1272]|nr:hypothetical protein GGR57DRAFT_471115 [Xylariaceae sp. FL1272]
MRTSVCKRHHTKSRNGCGQCKRRRVRCNLQAPICSNCVRRNERCDYLQGHHTNKALTSRALCAPGQTVSITGSSMLLSCADLFSSLVYNPPRENRGELFGYASAWSAQAECVTLTIQSGGYVIEDKGGTNEYLFPTIFSICDIFNALEFESDSQEIYAKAMQHNMRASSIFRYAEQGIDENNWLSIFMFGIGHVMFNFAAAQCAPDCAFDCLDIFHMLRGTARIGEEVSVHLERSGLGRIFDGERYLAVLPTTGPEDCLQAIDRLSLADYPDGTSEMTRAHCQQALERLKWWARVVNGAPRNWKHFILWPGSVTDMFVSALIEGQPVALLLYIYWCAIMYRAPRRWFADRWQHRVVAAALTYLEPGYAGLLEWPFRVLTSQGMEDA